MENKKVQLLLKILRVLLPAAAVVMGMIPGSYQKIKLVEGAQTAEEGIAYLDATYFSVSGGGFIDWVPMICMLLSIGAVAMGIYCLFKETENNLVHLAQLLCLAMVADLLLAIFMTPSVLSWCIAAALGIALTITAVQEIQMEKKKK